MAQRSSAMGDDGPDCFPGRRHGPLGTLPDRQSGHRVVVARARPLRTRTRQGRVAPSGRAVSIYASRMRLPPATVLVCSAILPRVEDLPTERIHDDGTER